VIGGLARHKTANDGFQTVKASGNCPTVVTFALSLLLGCLFLIGEKIGFSVK
jgi:hypothetical protein